jgi:hypothetical protein
LHKRKNGIHIKVNYKYTTTEKWGTKLTKAKYDYSEKIVKCIEKYSRSTPKIEYKYTKDGV